MKLIAMALRPINEFWAEVFKRPNDFGGFEHNPQPRVNTDEMAYILVPSKSWNEFQDWIDSKGLRDEAHKLFGHRFTIPIPYSNIKEVEINDK